jgi:hypothetical protein
MELKKKNLIVIIAQHKKRGVGGKFLIIEIKFGAAFCKKKISGFIYTRKKVFIFSLIHKIYFLLLDLEKKT